MLIKNSKKIVIKIGSSTVVNNKGEFKKEWVISLIEQIRSVRSELRVPAGVKIPLIQIEVEKKFKSIVKKNKILIERLARLSSVEESRQKLGGVIAITLEGGEFALKIAEFIDVEAERARLLKAVTINKEETQVLKNKMENEKFVSKAPSEVIKQTQLRLIELEQNSIKLSAAVARLKDLSMS